MERTQTFIHPSPTSSKKNLSVPTLMTRRKTYPKNCARLSGKKETECERKQIKFLQLKHTLIQKQSKTLID